MPSLTSVCGITTSQFRYDNNERHLNCTADDDFTRDVSVYNPLLDTFFGAFTRQITSGAHSNNPRWFLKLICNIIGRHSL